MGHNPFKRTAVTRAFQGALNVRVLLGPHQRDMPIGAVSAGYCAYPVWFEEDLGTCTAASLYANMWDGHVPGEGVSLVRCVLGDAGTLRVHYTIYA